LGPGEQPASPEKFTVQSNPARKVSVTRKKFRPIKKESTKNLNLNKKKQSDFESDSDDSEKS
jgi:hypothetical protein